MEKLPFVKKKQVEGSIEKRKISKWKKSIRIILEESRRIKANDPTNDTTRQYAVWF